MKQSMLRVSVWVSSEKERKKTKDMAIQINDRQWKENEYVFDKKRQKSSVGKFWGLCWINVCDLWINPTAQEEHRI